MSSGWVPMDAAWWPQVADAMTATGKPWPDEAILFDLRWWADQERVGAATRPGRPALCERWCVTSWRARKLMSEEERWSDPVHPSPPPARRQPAASSPPASRQRPASAPPAEERTNAENQDDSASPPPASRQRAASSPPAGRQSAAPRAEYTPRHRTPTQSTEHTHTSGGSERGGAAGPDPGGVCDPDPPHPDVGATPEPDPPPRSVPRWLTDGAARLGWSVDDTARTVAACVSAVRAEPVPLDRCGPDAPSVLALAESTGMDPSALVDAVQLVAQAAHDERCRAWTFARLVRGEAFARTDAPRDDQRHVVREVLRPDRWTQRLDAARAHARSLSVVPARPPWADEVEAIAESLRSCLAAGQEPRPVGVPWADGWALCEDDELHDRRLAAVLCAAARAGLSGWRAWLREPLVHPWPPETDGDLWRDSSPMDSLMSDGVEARPTPDQRRFAVGVHAAMRSGETAGRYGLIAAMLLGRLYPAAWSAVDAICPAIGRVVAELADESDATGIDWTREPERMARHLGLTPGSASLRVLEGGLTTRQDTGAAGSQQGGA